MAPVSDRGGRRRRGGSLSLDDCRCPVCLEIFIEPVTLPCTHTFCKECFLESVDKATLCCPLCRKRVSTWARLNSRTNTLVDQQLWMQIQTCFPLQCQRRLDGQDALAEDGPGVCCPRVSQPGELKQEYEDQVTKLTEEKRVMEEEERRASEEFIQKLLAEEEELQQEETRRRQEDETMARLLSSQLNSAPISQDNVGPDVTPAKKKKKKEVSGGQMDKFLCPLPSNSSSSVCSFMANKENILLSQVKLQVERLHPRLDYCRPPDRPEPPSASPAASPSVEVHLTGDGRPSSAKRKSSEPETTEDEEVTGCCSLPSSSSSLAAAGGSALQGVAEWEAEMLSRRQQEEEDRRLALLLQKELDQEERQRATDRRKGSSDPYLLRHTGRGTSSTPSKTKTSTPSSAKTSTPSSAKTSTPSFTKTSTSSSPSSRGSKQATLTEMFFSLSS
ncbi:E3 ubiquitin-protein ligase rnf168 [Sebastes fasciatus]|uniref:E3 ubiquitin-protein ligase rnf168 n=1 Tax=Sebastes fasciatus TaxID=394691 RepID=UPI003D9E682E